MKVALWGFFFLILTVIGLLYGVDPKPAVPDDLQYPLYGFQIFGVIVFLIALYIYDRRK